MRVGIRAAMAALALGSSMATHAHYGADAAAAVDDTCAASPMQADVVDWDTWRAWSGLWDGDDYRVPFTLGPVQEGVTTKFGTASQSVFRSGRARITIRLDDAYGWDRKRTFRLVARSLASLPGPLIQRVPPSNLNLTQTTDDGAAYGGAGILSGSFVGNVTVPSRWFALTDGKRPVPVDAFEHMLVHEFAHVMDYTKGISVFLDPTTYCDDSNVDCLHSGTEEWQAAIAESPCAVSAYATTNEMEDFAESVIAWFGYYAGRQGRLEPSARSALRERLGKRFGVLNKLMHGRFDWELTQQGELVSPSTGGRLF